MKHFAEQLLGRGLVHVLASDAHSAGAPRPPTLEHGVQAAALLRGRETVEHMVLDTPLAILENRQIRESSPERPPAKERRGPDAARCPPSR